MECQLCGNIAIDQENDFKYDVSPGLNVIVEIREIHYVLPINPLVKVNPLIQTMTCYIGNFITDSCQDLDG